MSSSLPFLLDPRNQDFLDGKDKYPHSFQPPVWRMLILPSVLFAVGLAMIPLFYLEFEDERDFGGVIVHYCMLNVVFAVAFTGWIFLAFIPMLRLRRQQGRYARISWTTFPLTSVKRKSRLWKR